MKQEYFVVVLAHSLRGRLRRVHIPHSAVYAVLVLALLGCFSVFGFVASYGRMALKVANYNALEAGDRQPPRALPGVAEERQRDGHPACQPSSFTPRK